MSGLETWTTFGLNSVRSRRTLGGIASGIRYSDRPGIGIAGMLTTSPVAGKAGFSTVGE